MFDIKYDQTIPKNIKKNLCIKDMANFVKVQMTKRL